MSVAVMTKEVTVEEAKTKFEALIADVQKRKAEVVVKRAGEVIARIVPSYSSREEARRRFLTQSEELKRKFADVPTPDLELQIDRAVNEVRAQRKQAPRA